MASSIKTANASCSRGAAEKAASIASTDNRTNPTTHSVIDIRINGDAFIFQALPTQASLDVDTLRERLSALQLHPQITGSQSGHCAEPFH